MENLDYTSAVEETKDLFNPFNSAEDTVQSNDISEYIDALKEKVQTSDYSFERVDNETANIRNESSEKIASFRTHSDGTISFFDENGQPTFEYDTVDDDFDTIVQSIADLVQKTVNIRHEEDTSAEDFLPEGGVEVLDEATNLLEKTLSKLNEIRNFNELHLNEGATKEESDRMLEDKLTYASKLWREACAKLNGIL